MIPFCQSRNSTCWPATSSQEVGRPVPAATTPLHTWSTITGSPSLVIASGTWPSGPANTKQEAQCFCSPHTDIRTSSSVILSFCHCTPVSRTHASGDNTWTSGCQFAGKSCCMTFLQVLAAHCSMRQLYLLLHTCQQLQRVGAVGALGALAVLACRAATCTAAAAGPTDARATHPRRLEAAPRCACMQCGGRPLDPTAVTEQAAIWAFAAGARHEPTHGPETYSWSPCEHLSAHFLK